MGFTINHIRNIMLLKPIIILLVFEISLNSNRVQWNLKALEFSQKLKNHRVKELKRNSKIIYSRNTSYTTILEMREPV